MPEQVSVQRPVFRISDRRVDDRYLLQVSGELDLATNERVVEAIKRAEASDAKTIVLDLTEVSFIDSSGIRALVQGALESRENGQRLRLVPVQGQVRRVLEMCGLLNHFNFTD
jgi:anti-sigma B factor antagonist